MQKQEVRKHVEHGWMQRDTSHIRHVPYLETHFLMSCLPEDTPSGCGFYGWVPRGEVPESG